MSVIEYNVKVYRTFTNEEIKNKLTSYHFFTLEQFIAVNLNTDIFNDNNDVYNKYIKLLDLHRREGYYYVHGIETLRYTIIFDKWLIIRDKTFKESSDELYTYDIYNFFRYVKGFGDLKYVIIKPAINPFKNELEQELFTNLLYESDIQYLRSNEDFDVAYNRYINYINNIRGLHRIIEHGKQLTERQNNSALSLLNKIPIMELYKEWLRNRIL